MSSRHNKPAQCRHLASGFDVHALQSPAAPALSFWYHSTFAAAPQQEQLDYRSLSELSVRCAAFLSQQLTSGPVANRVAWTGGNSTLLPALYLACARTGSVLALFEPGWPDAVFESAHQLVQPRLTLEEATLADELTRADELARDQASPESTTGTLSDPFLIGFSSGSSGTPKAFIRTQQSWDATFRAAAAEFEFSPGRIVLAPGPLSHGLSFYAMAETLHTGGHFMSLAKFEAQLVLTVLSRCQVHTLVVVPTMLEALLPQFETNDEFLAPACIISAGAKLSPRLRRQLQQRLPTTTISEYYGASELSFVTVAHGSENGPADSVGRAFAGVELDIRNDAAQSLPPGDIGTVWVRSDMLADEILHSGADPQRVADADGWATVGDVGKLDASGHLTLVDRASNMIISGGLNVYPADVERILSEHDTLQEIIVIGIPDDYWGERLCAVCQLRNNASKDNANMDIVALRQFGYENLTAAQRPARYFLVADWPLTSSGKINRREVQRRVQQNTAWATEIY